MTYSSRAVERLERRITSLESALQAIRGWDMLDVCADGPWAKRLIDDALAESPFVRPPIEDTEPGFYDIAGKYWYAGIVVGLVAGVLLLLVLDRLL